MKKELYNQFFWHKNQIKKRMRAVYYLLQKNIEKLKTALTL
jgi:hypothetical protein